MPWDCSHCEAENEDERRFCRRCGKAHGCPHCHFLNDVEARYCGGCGKKLREAKEGLLGQFFSEWNDPNANIPRILGFNEAEVLIESQLEQIRLAGNREQQPVHMSQGQLDELFDEEEA